MNFELIVADPPWSFDDGLKKMRNPVKRSAVSQYPTMTPSEVCALDVENLANPDGCVLALWTPGSMLQHGLEAISAWGFTYKQNFVWVKIKNNALKIETDMNKMTRVGMGRLFRQSHEIALIATRNKTPRKSIYNLLDNKGQRSVAFDLNKGHSTKPPTLQDRLELMFPAAKKLEMFARRNRSGWTSIGDGVTNRDIKDSIKDLVEL